MIHFPYQATRAILSAEASETAAEEEAWAAFDAMEWAKPKFPRNQVDKAGFVIARPHEHLFEEDRAFDVLNNWRAAHAFPLNTFQVNLRALVRRLPNGGVVAQRLKRVRSIRAKLTRDQTSTLQLSQMQDIAGCRAIVPNVADVRKLVEMYKRSKSAHLLKGEKDYIIDPKPDGYRGIHLIYQYQAKPGQIADYNKLRVEVQLRTQLQHAWATAVEAVGTFIDQALKSNQGSRDWLRFFALASSGIASIERAPIIPGTPTDYREMLDELRALQRKLKVYPTLNAYGATLDYVGATEAKNSKYFLLQLAHGKQFLQVTGFRAEQSQLANQRYTEAERQSEEGDQIVLVSVDSLAGLKKAYPNYLLDTTRFATVLQNLLKSAPGTTFPAASVRPHA